MKTRNEERPFTHVKTLTHQGHAFAFASSPTTRSGDGSEYDEVFWCVLNPAVGTEVEENIDAGDLTVDDGWTELIPLNCATETRVAGMNLLLRDIPGEDANGDPNTTASLTQANPFIVVSDGDYIYLFRTTSLDPQSQGSNDTFPVGLLVDRFIFQQQDMALAHATETRYVRSENADVPASDKDSLGSESMDGEPFLEPAFLLPLDVQFSPTSTFAVVRVPVGDKSPVWHIFAPQDQYIVAFSIPASLFVPFDVSQLHGFNKFSTNTNKQTFPLIEPSAKYLPVHNNDDDGSGQNTTPPVSNLSATLYYRQEPAYTNDSGAISVMTNAGIMLSLSCGQLFSVLDIDLGLNGRLAGSSTEKWMNSDPEAVELNLPEIPFYGTALELNGRSDYITLPNSSASGHTFEAWIMPYANPQEDQCIFELEFGDGDDKSSGGICLMNDLHLGLFKINPETRNLLYPTILDQLPPLPPNVWTHIAFTFSSSGYLKGYLNGWEVGDFQISPSPIGQPVGATVGRSELAHRYYFKGLIGEMRIWDSKLVSRQLNKYRSIDVLEQKKDSGINSVYQMDEGQGNTLINKVEGSTHENAVCQGGRWIGAASASRISMPLVGNRDKGLLAIYGAVLPDVQTRGAAALLPSADGLIRMAYRRTDDHWGSIHYDTRTQRNQVILSWQGSQDNQMSVKLRFVALAPGTLFNLGGVFIKNDTEHDGMITITMSENVLKNDKFGLYECWTAVPRKLSSIVDIINGRMPNSVKEPGYNYTENVTRMLNGTVLTEDQLPERLHPYASLLFGATGIHQLGEDLDQFVPDNPSPPNSVQYAFLAASDPQWVLDPVPAAVKNPVFWFEDSAADKLQLDGDVTLEAWAISSDHLTGTNTILFQGYGNTPYVFGLTKDNHLYAAKNKGSDIVFAIGKDPVPDSMQWTHLAAAYRSSWGLHLHDEAYIRCGKLQREPGEAITVEAWVCPDTESINSGKVVPIISQWAPEMKDKRFKLALDSGKPVFSIQDNNDNEYIVSGEKSLTKGAWTHLSGVYQATGTKNMLYFPESHNSYAAVLENRGIPSSTVTIEMWIRPEKKDNDRSTLISCARNDKANSLFELSIDTKGELKLYYITKKDGNRRMGPYSTGVNIPFASDKNDDSADMHLAVVFDWIASSIIVYINGVPQQLNSDKPKPDYDFTDSLPAFGWIIGAALKDLNEDGNINDTEKHYIGGMREVRLWSTVRTQQQIIDHLNVPVSTSEAGLEGYWSLNAPPNDNKNDFGDSNGDDSGDNSGNKITIHPRITNAVNTVSVKVCGDAYFYAAPVKSSLTLYVNNSQPAINNFEENQLPAKLNTGDATLYIGKEDSKTSEILAAIVDDIRIWTTARLSAQIDYYRKRAIDDPEKHTDLAAYWNFDEGKGQEVRDETGGNPGKIMGVRNIDKTDEDNPFWIPTPITSYWTLFVDGVKIGIDTDPGNNPDHPDPSVGAWLGLPRGYSGYLAEVRVWDIRRKQSAIQSTLNRTLRGDETGLVAYWPCNDNQGSGTDGEVGLSDKVINPCDALFSSSSPNIPSQVWAQPGTDLPYPVPVADDVQYAINISNKVMTREAEALELSSSPAITELEAGEGKVHIGIKSGSITWLLDTDEEPDATDLVYIGQIQTNAQIVGFIEGAPPLPSENLGIEQSSTPDKYLGTSSVTLEEGDHVRFSNIKEASSGGGGSLDLSIGYKENYQADAVVSPFGIGTISHIAGGSGHFMFNLKFDGIGQRRKVTSGRIADSRNKTSSIIVDGAFEQNLYNIGCFSKEEVGVQPKRIYRPNNMGSAIVKSLVADFYALRSKRTGATMGYRIVPDPNIPPDTNIIMFKLNPGYVKNGTLDGYVGFDKDVHYKDLGPDEKGSYYKVQEAYTIKGKIERQRAEYKNFSKSLRSGKLKKDDVNFSMVNTYVWAADGGLSSEEMSGEAARREAHGPSWEIKAQAGLNMGVEFLFGVNALMGRSYNLDFYAVGDFQGFHTKVNGEISTFSLESKVGGEGFLGKQAIPVPNVNVTGLDWGYRPQTPGDFSYLDPSANALTKALIDAGVVSKIRVRYEPETYTTNYTIYEDKDGNCILEDVAGIFKVALDNDTDPTKASFTPYVQTGQYPINYQAAPCPGKVLGYRFMSFYLDPDKKNFDALANTKRPDEQIIDQDWLNNSKDPNAVALKDALTRRNEVWRVFHRVTYVNRVPPDESSENAGDIKHVTIPNKTKRPDDISTARNSLLTPILLGYNPQITDSFPNIQHSGYPPNIQIIDKNIALVVESMNLPKLQAEKLANQLHKYMISYIAPDQETDIFSLKIQAEYYTDSYGVALDSHAQTENGIDVGYMSRDGWMEYNNINIPKSGNYTIEYRVSTDCDNIRLSLQVDGGQKNSLDIPNTHDWSHYITIENSMYIEEGMHDFRINSETGAWNFEWWRITEAPPAESCFAESVGLTAVEDDSSA
ncbi:LamG-like jellyroll fold domain-containing protein [Sinomicrobium weinanense]|uniref:Carbohydrate-binding protein n=1 Tax=Sinomicrobium weinanense TaxID=2842200 RepID=A0A926Q332_9FLAO|nr:LamG-like jellyroll fold domain-containing protein [Sinomicrobium weinanense]MBC9797227.1 carbohydrate-binding protein [Sinomicrobium weinanense]MBU3125560.1 carbohydrate-binding protein [Sinomicrobium weinanense]